MSAVDEYSKKYPELWELVKYDPAAFLTHLADRGIIESRMIVPLVAQHELAVKLREPPVEYDLEYYKTRYPEQWETLKDSPGTFVRELARAGVMPYSHEVKILIELGAPVITEAERAAIMGVPFFDVEKEARIEQEAAQRDVPVEQVRVEYRARGEIGDALFDKIKEWFKIAYREVLVSLWKWLIEKLKELIDLVVGVLQPVLERAWDQAKGKIQEWGTKVYDEVQNLFEGHSPVKPEDAPILAVKLYLAAMTAGMGAHGISTLVELLHPLKQVGLHQTAAIVGDFAGFSRISGATIGPLVSRVLGQAMTYNVQNRFRPNIPRETLLIELRSKREIDKAKFDEAMGYQGFDKDWIDVIERWQWKDPRMFELMRVADIGIDQGPPPAEEEWWFKKVGITGEKRKDWWLYRKLMRAGYEDVDLDVLVRTIHRREISFAMTYVRTAVRRNYRWGYLTDKELGEWIDRLLLPEQAKEWIFWAGQLDREYFYRQDLVRYYTLAFRNDVLDEDELLVSLLSMGLPPRETTIIVRTEKVRKSPKVVRPVAKPAVKAMTAVQKKYITLYRDQFRKDLIGESKYLESLLAIGLDPQLAEISVELEVVKKTPAPSPL